METTMPTFKRKTTIGEKYDPAMVITEQEQADVYFIACVEHTLRWHEPKITREEAEKIERQNLGYYAGYYDHETRARVERLFKCAHPYFGSIEKNGPPAPETAFNIGAAIGAAAKAAAVAS